MPVKADKKQKFSFRDKLSGYHKNLALLSQDNQIITLQKLVTHCCSGIVGRVGFHGKALVCDELGLRLKNQLSFVKNK